MSIYETVSIVYDQKDNTFAFVAADMKKAIEFAGYKINLINLGDTSAVSAQNRIILTTRGTKAADHFLRLTGITQLPYSEPQGYSIRKKSYEKYTDWYVIGFDKKGAMYGGLDFGQSIKFYGFDALGDCDKKPYIKERGIKFNIPLDARTPSYSDSGDSAQANIANMWDMDFWCEFLDEMARDHLNVLSLWNLHPFPSMVKVPLYPNAALSDVKKTTTLLTAELQGRGMSTSASLEHLKTLKMMTIDEKIKFWQEVMQYAKDRGIGIYIFTWNAFVYGTESSGYGFTTSLSDERTKDYHRRSVEALINTYPLLKGIGILAGENMSHNADADEAWLYDTYGQGINDALTVDESREFRLIHRIRYENIHTALNAFSGLNSRCSIDTSFKYSQAHMYSSSKPNYIHEYNDLYLNAIGNHKTWLTLRDDDYYMFRGGSDPEFVRVFVKNIPCEKLQGFYIGPDGYTWGREHISKDPESPNQQIIKKRWYSFMFWGKLAFDPEIPQADFIKVLNTRFPEVNAQSLFEAWSKASQLIPLVNRLRTGDYQLDFQWYPEACTSNTGFHDINRFIKTAPQSGEGIMSIPDYADALLRKGAITGTTPVEIANSLWELSSQALNLTNSMSGVSDKELSQTIEDINAMATLGKYYSRKIFGATYKCIADKASNMNEKAQYKNAAIENLKEASDYWRNYAAKVSSQYLPQTLTRLIPDEKYTPGLPRHTDVAELQVDADNDILLSGGTLASKYDIAAELESSKDNI